MIKQCLAGASRRAGDDNRSICPCTSQHTKRHWSNTIRKHFVTVMYVFVEAFSTCRIRYPVSARISRRQQLAQKKSKKEMKGNLRGALCLICPCAHLSIDPGSFLLGRCSTCWSNADANRTISSCAQETYTLWAGKAESTRESRCSVRQKVPRSAREPTKQCEVVWRHRYYECY